MFWPGQHAVISETHGLHVAGPVYACHPRDKNGDFYVSVSVSIFVFFPPHLLCLCRHCFVPLSVVSVVACASLCRCGRDRGNPPEAAGQCRNGVIAVAKRGKRRKGRRRKRPQANKSPSVAPYDVYSLSFVHTHNARRAQIDAPKGPYLRVRSTTKVGSEGPREEKGMTTAAGPRRRSSRLVPIRRYLRRWQSILVFLACREQKAACDGQVVVSGQSTGEHERVRQ